MFLTKLLAVVLRYDLLRQLSGRIEKRRRDDEPIGTDTLKLSEKTGALTRPDVLQRVAADDDVKTAIVKF